jgi:hypothetical protein
VALVDERNCPPSELVVGRAVRVELPKHHRCVPKTTEEQCRSRMEDEHVLEHWSLMEPSLTRGYPSDEHDVEVERTEENQRSVDCYSVDHVEQAKSAEREELL